MVSNHVRKIDMADWMFWVDDDGDGDDDAAFFMDGWCFARLYIVCRYFVVNF